MPQLPSASFRSNLERFEEYNEIRHKKSNREENRFSHLGPGIYDPRDDSLSIHSRCTSPKMYPEKIKKDEKNFVSDAPCVGTYDIQRDMSPIHFTHLENSSNRNVTSSFRSCGREKPLMGCGQIYMTLREDLKTTNRGPGMYVNITPSFGGRVSYSPTFADSRHRMNMAKSISSTGSVDSRDSGSPKQRGRLSDIWRPSTSSGEKKASEKMNTAMKTLDTHSFVSAAELKRNIEQVRNLPDYPR